MEKSSHWQKLFFEVHFLTLLKVAFRYVGTYEQAVEMTYQGIAKIFNQAKRLKPSQNNKEKKELPALVKKIFIISLVDKINSDRNLHIPRPIPEDIWQEPGTQTDFTSQTVNIEIIKVLKELPVMNRLVFNLHVIDGFSHGEIAKMLRIRVENSQFALNEAREYCTRALKRIKFPGIFQYYFT